MNGKPLGGRQIRVSVATARKSIGGSCGDSSSSMSSTSSNYAVETAESANTTLFVGGLSEDVTEQDLIEAFAPHGQLVYTKIPQVCTFQSFPRMTFEINMTHAVLFLQGKGCGFVQYAYRPCAVNAKNAIHGQVIGKSPVRISWGRQQGLRSAAWLAEATAVNNCLCFSCCLGVYSGPIHTCRYNKIGQNNMNHQAHQHVPHQFGYPQGFYQGYYDPSLAAYFGPYAGYYPRMPAMDPAMYQVKHPSWSGLGSQRTLEIAIHPGPAKTPRVLVCSWSY